MAFESAHEELIGSTELARAVSATLDRAATHPVTVHRDRREDVTIVKRDAWQRLRRAQDLDGVVLALSVATARRFSHSAQTYPAGMHWLEWLDNDDFAEFLEEFALTARDVIAGSTLPEAVAELVHAWEQTAYALRDPHLLARFAEAGPAA